MSFFIIFLAEYLYLLVILITIIYIFGRQKLKQKRFLILTLIAFPIIYLLARLASLFYFNPRPFVEGHFKPLISHSPDNGLPSDHALLTSAISQSVFLSNKKLGLILWVISVLVSIGRVLAGVHHVVDILAAYFISVIVTSASQYFIKKQAEIQSSSNY